MKDLVAIVVGIFFLIYIFKLTPVINKSITLMEIKMDNKIQEAKGDEKWLLKL